MAWGGIEPPTQGFSVQDTPLPSAKKRNGFLPVGVLLPNLLPNSFGPAGWMAIRFFYVNQGNSDTERRALADRTHDAKLRCLWWAPVLPILSPAMDLYAAIASSFGIATVPTFAASSSDFADRRA